MTSFNEQFNELVKVTLSENNSICDDDKNLQVMDESAKSQDFFQDYDNTIGKRYTTTRIKSRNVLSNIAYVDINKEDYYNENFVFDVYLLITKNLNPFSLDRKLADKTKHVMIYMLWKECMPQKFYRHICKEKNFLYLNGKTVLQPKVLEIIKEFLDEDQSHYKELRSNLSNYKSIFQYIYSNVFPEIYCSIKKRGFDLKSNFHIIFKTYKDKKQLESSLGKNPENYENIRKETNIYEQKPVTIAGFNKVEEKEVKERVEKRRQKRREVAEKNKLLKKKRKQEETKVKEKDMWKRWNELNSEFQEHKKTKKDAKKMSATIIKH